MSATTTNAQAQSAAPTFMAVVFLLSLVVPIVLPVGPILLMPHRMVLLVFFIPCVLRLFAGQAGPIIAPDWLLFGATLWAAVALIANHGLGNTIEPIGIHIIEFFGAYLLARVSIRTGEDFHRVVRTVFLISLCLLPFAAIESITKRAVLLEVIPKSIPVVSAPYRWGMRRAQVLFTHPIHFGVFSAVGMGLFWYCIGQAKHRFLTAPLVVVSTIFSLSSGALICVVCQVMFISWEFITKSIEARWRIFGGIAALFYLITEFGTNRGPWVMLVDYASFNTGSAYNRILIWQYGIENVKTNPIFGLGFREWERAPWMSTSADNFWLLLTMMFGLPATVMMFAALFIIFRKVARMSFTDLKDKASQAAYLTAFGGIFIGGATVHYWTAMMGFVLFFFGSGIWMITGGGKSPEDADTPEPSAPEPISRYTRFAPKSNPRQQIQAQGGLRTARTTPTEPARANRNMPSQPIRARQI